MWYDLHLLISFLTSFLGSTSVFTRIDQSNSNEKWALINSIETIDLPSSSNRQLEMPDFAKYTTRISEKKCMEYIYEMLKRQENSKLSQSDVTIINGKVVKEAEYPHMGALGWWAYAGKKRELKKLVFLCGASLISDRFMLTAAHCTYVSRTNFVQPTPYLVRLGSRYLEKSPHEVPKDVTIQKFIRYSCYLAPYPYYDIALVKLNEQVKFSKFIQPACLPSKRSYSHLTGEKKIIATGWGSVRAEIRNIVPSTELRSAEISIFNKETCDFLLDRFKYRYWMGLQEHQMCAGELDGNSDTCQGDSGGPLQYALVNTTSEGTIHRILAITAFGLTRCATQNAPGVYTRISYFIPWIERNVWPREYEMFDDTKCTKDSCQ